MKPVLLSWSGGKDSALALARLRAESYFEVVGLLTTVTTTYDRVSIHGVRRSLLRSQASALDLPLEEIELAAACSNEQYQAAWKAALEQLHGPMAAAHRIAFGDIFLADVREYREALARSMEYEAIFPLWGEPTHALAEEVVDSSIIATTVCVDTHVLGSEYVGRRYDRSFLASLPSGIDPCGERGEFHTFVSNGPGFIHDVPFCIGETVLRDARFAFCDLLPAHAA